VTHGKSDTLHLGEAASLPLTATSMEFDEILGVHPVPLWAGRARFLRTESPTTAERTVLLNSADSLARSPYYLSFPLRRKRFSSSLRWRSLRPPSVFE